MIFKKYWVQSTIGISVVSLLALLYFFNSPEVKSTIWYYKKQMIYNSFIEDQEKTLSAQTALNWPDVDKKIMSTPAELPKDYQMLLQAFLKPEVSEAVFDDKTKGWIIRETSTQQPTCPTFPNRINREMFLSFNRKLSHLSRYQYVKRNQLVLIETRLRAFACEIEVVIKTFR